MCLAERFHTLLLVHITTKKGANSPGVGRSDTFGTPAHCSQLILDICPGVVKKAQARGNGMGSDW